MNRTQLKSAAGVPEDNPKAFDAHLEEFLDASTEQDDLPFEHASSDTKMGAIF